MKANGFSTFTSEEIRFTRGENKELAVQLKVAAINASVVVTATGTAQRADEVSKVVSTLDAQEIEAKHELTLPEALRGTPGVRVQQQGSPGSLTTLRLRGQRNFDTALLLDGLRVRDAGDINGSALSLMSDLVPVALDRVEVLRGAGSSIYGTHAIGGVVNMIPDVGSLGFSSERRLRRRQSRNLSRTSRRHQAVAERLRFRARRESCRRAQRHRRRRRLRKHRFRRTSSDSIRRRRSRSPVISYGNIANARVNDSPFRFARGFRHDVSDFRMQLRE